MQKPKSNVGANRCLSAIGRVMPESGDIEVKTSTIGARRRRVGMGTDGVKVKAGQRGAKKKTTGRKNISGYGKDIRPPRAFARPVCRRYGQNDVGLGNDEIALQLCPAAGKISGKIQRGGGDSAAAV